MSILLGGVGVAALLVLVTVLVIVGKVFGKPIGFLFKLAGILIGLLFIALAIIASLPYLLIGAVILLFSVILIKLIFHKKKA